MEGVLPTLALATSRNALQGPTDVILSSTRDLAVVTLWRMAVGKLALLSAQETTLQAVQ